MRRFIPYLWPAGERALKARVVSAFIFLGFGLGSAAGATAGPQFP